MWAGLHSWLLMHVASWGNDVFGLNVEYLNRILHCLSLSFRAFSIDSFLGIGEKRKLRRKKTVRIPRLTTFPLRIFYEATGTKKTQLCHGCAFRYSAHKKHSWKPQLHAWAPFQMGVDRMQNVCEFEPVRSCSFVDYYYYCIFSFGIFFIFFISYLFVV